MLFKKLVSFSFLSSCAFGLVACQVPHAVPTGYTHHAKEFKSPTPPQSPKFTSQQRSSMGPEQADQFRLAVYDLAENITMRAGMPPKPVYILRADPMTPFYANIDNDLRESLRHLGYKIADTHEGAYIMTYNAAPIKQPELPEGAVHDTVVVSSTQNNSVSNVRIGLYIYDGIGEQSTLLTKEEGEFYVRGADAMSIPFAQFKEVFVPAFSDDYRTVPVHTMEKTN